MFILTARVAGSVPADNVYIDGKGIGDIGTVVLKDRKILSEDGLLSVVVTVNEKERKVVGNSVIISRGFVYMKEQTELTKALSDRVDQLVKGILDKYDTIKTGLIKRDIIRLLNDYIYTKTERNPMILPVVKLI